MKILLINPPYAFSEVPIMPMGLAYIAAVLERDGHDVKILDLLVSRYTEDKVRSSLKEHRPQLVGTTSVTMNYPIASDILRCCKEFDRNITAVIGGPHVTFCPEKTLSEAPWIDIVVRGEGELTILDIVHGKSLEDVDGIAYRKNGGEEISLTGDRALIQNLDQLPLPARHLFPLSKYLALDCHCSIVAGRGCPFNCIFCVGSKMGGRRARFRNPKLVVDEIETVIAYGFHEVNLEDDLLTLNHRHVHAFCDEILTRGLKFNWSVFARADTVNLELLRKMKEAGCTWMLYGVESGNQHILDTARKKITLDKIKEGVRLANEAGIRVLASFIAGLPGETKETLEDTFRFAAELNTTWGFNVLSPFPGTEVRENAKEYGIEILTDDWSLYDANRAVTRTQGVGPEEIAEALRKYDGLLIQHLQNLESDDKGDLISAAEARNMSPLAWALLQDDVIESLGSMELKGDPVEGLVNKIAEIMPYPRRHVGKNIRDWIDGGLLQYEADGRNMVWRWAPTGQSPAASSASK